MKHKNAETMKKEIAYEARAEFLEGSSNTGVLVMHGFTGSTQSMRPIAYALHKNGYTVSLPRLEGHGTSAENMATTNYNDWIKSAENAYHELKSKVKNIYVLGLSMGGTLALYLAQSFEIKGIITINAAVLLPPEFVQLATLPGLPDFIDGIGSDIKKEGVKEWAYSQTPRKCIGEIAKLCNIVRDKLDEIKQPILIFKSLEDHIVPPTNQNYIFEHVGSSINTLIELQNSYHVATLDNDAEFIIETTSKFIENTDL